MMVDQNRQDEALGLWNLRNALGAPLILSGLGAALGALVGIYTLLVSPQELTVFQQLFLAHVTITWDGGNLSIPSEILAYSLPIILLLIAGGLATTLISSGFNLLQLKR